MALLLNVRTPKKPTHDDRDSAHDESLLASSSPEVDEQVNVNPAPDVNAGQQMSDVPSTLNFQGTKPTASTSRRSELRRSAAPSNAMGSNNSREEINAAVHATVAKLNDGSGKLKRPSAALLAPSSGRRTTRATTTASGMQRRMGPSAQTRPDAYAMDLWLEEDVPPLRPKPVSGATGFSPTREQRAAKQVLPPPYLRSLAEAHAEDQRRINEQLEADQQAQQSTTRLRKSRLSHDEGEEVWAEDESNEEMSTQVAHEKSWFPDRAPGAAAGGASIEKMGEEPDEGLADQQQNAASTGAGKRSRPPRQSSSRAHRSANAQDEMVEEGLRRSARINTTDVPRTTSPKTNVPQRNHKGRILKARASPRKSGREQQEIADDDDEDEDEDEDNDDEHVVRQHAEMTAGATDEHNDTAWDAARIDNDWNDEEDEEKGSGSEEQTDEERRRPARPDQAGPNEMFPHDTRLLDEFQSSPAKPSGQQGRKRTRSSRDEEFRNAANTSRKRGRFSPTSQDAEALEQVDERDDELGNGNHRFYGQWKHLRTVFEAENDIGVNVSNGKRMEQRRYKLNDVDVITIINICNSAMEKLEGGEDAVDEFNEIGERVNALHQNGADNPVPNQQDVRKCRNIYCHLFPALARLLRKVIETYEETDRDTQPPGTVRIGHLNIVIGLIELILDLGEGMKKFEKPKSSLAVVRPVKNSVIAALKPVHAALCRESLRHAREENKALRLREAAAERERESREEQMKRQQQDNIRRIRSEWHHLHIERIWAEGGFLDHRKREHLTEPQIGTEYDQEGQPFERLEVFAPRVGPPPAMVEAASERVWRMAELDALVSGLKRYQGPDVYWKIFREYCGRTGLLNKYNVTEIVTVAANMKEYYTNLQQEANGQVEDWVKAIPVWTRGHPLGKENTDNEDGEDDIIEET